MLEKELKYYQENVKDWYDTHPGRFALIFESSVQGFYDSFDEAYRVGIESFEDKPFLIKLVEINDEGLEISIPALQLGILYALHSA